VSTSPGTDSADVFRRSWRAYEKFVTHNWMCHREVYAEVRRVAGRYQKDSLTIADFGCGDAACTAAALSDLPVSRFIGVDRVPALLDSAGERFRSRGCNVTLLEADLLSAVSQPPAEKVDLLLAAFSVHHLRSAEKQQFFTDARAWLKPGGRLVLIDLLTHSSDSRRQYLDRFARFLVRDCRAMSPDERQLVRDHMQSFDFPEPLPEWSRLLQTAGWNAPRLAFRDRRGFYMVLISAPAGSSV
jgi:cyclopropane fatty-acyl-phospholipid synthase-like methyltransferase